MNFFTALFSIFLVLKLVGVISWSWWLVTCPLWGGFIFSVVFTFIYAFICALGFNPKKGK